MEYYTVLVDTNKKCVFISELDKSFFWDSDGKLQIPIMEPGAYRRGLREFENEMRSMVGEHQRMHFYELFTTCSKVGLNETMEKLGTDRETARKILRLGILHGVLTKADSQWKLNVMMKDAVRNMIMVHRDLQSYTKDTPPEYMNDEPFEASEHEKEDEQSDVLGVVEEKSTKPTKKLKAKPKTKVA